MKIYVTSATGKGPTKLAAFDNALMNAGVANYNLIKLSSIIPAESEVIKVDNLADKAPGKWGDRLYAVFTDQRIDTPNEEAWAGIGWRQDPKTGQGIFVEHDGASKTAVESNIRDSLQALSQSREIDLNGTEMTVDGLMCHGTPVCALAIAVYEAESW